MDAEHGRLEIRTYWITSDIAWLGAKASWPNLHSIGMVESHREVGDHIAEERRYYLTSLPCDATQFAKAVREHWGVENSLHWVLDVSFREDDCRIAQRRAPKTLPCCAISPYISCSRKVGISGESKRGGNARVGIDNISSRC